MLGCFLKTFTHRPFRVSSLQDQFGQQKVPDWQRVAGKAAKEVEKFAKEKADIVLMHWRDKMGIAQKEVRRDSLLAFLPLFRGFILGQ